MEPSPIGNTSVVESGSYVGRKHLNGEIKMMILATINHIPHLMSVLKNN